MKTHSHHSHAADHAQSLTVIAHRALHQLHLAMHAPLEHLGAVLNVSLLAVSIAIVLWLAYKALHVIGCTALDLIDPGTRGSGGHKDSGTGAVAVQFIYCASMGLVAAGFASMATGAGPAAFQLALH